MGMGEEYLENQEAEMGKIPQCHFTDMEYEFADDGCYTVEYLICKHCGHTKELGREFNTTF